MPSPFPGMDPYLEQPATWASFTIKHSNTDAPSASYGSYADIY